MEKKVIYNSESFGNVITEINSHITSIKDSFNDKFALESYKGSSADTIEMAFQNLLDSLKTWMNSLDDITELMNAYKAKYDELINSNKASVGGDNNV